jgi:hypothetical protein
MKPPLLPAEALRRTLRLARMDGISVLAIAGAFALISGAARDLGGAAVGLLVAAAGAAELHGVTLIRNGFGSGVRWLIGSQLYLMIVIFAYVGYRLGHIDIGPMRALLKDDQRAVIQQANLTEDEFLIAVYRIAYDAVALATLLYQGGMALYYRRRRAPILAALKEAAAA